MKIKIPKISLKNLKELFSLKPKKEINIPFHYESEVKNPTDYSDAPSLEVIKNTYQEFLEEVKARENITFKKPMLTEEDLLKLRLKASLERVFGMFKRRANGKFFDY